jgi:hypothetical protein
MDKPDRDRDYGDEDRMSGSSEDRMSLDDPLGIAREPVSKDDRIRASSDEDSVRRRRKRAGLDEFQERSTGIGDLDLDPHGATGIDMGYGGEGTNISDKE